MYLNITRSAIVFTILVGLVAATSLFTVFAHEEDVPPPPGNLELLTEPIVKGDASFTVKLEPVADGLIAPGWGTFAPGVDDGRLYVTDQAGTLWAINLSTGVKTVFLDVSGLLVDLGLFGPGTFDERGLLGVAFHPEYASNGLLYTYTSQPAKGKADFSTMPKKTKPNHQSVITEWQVPSPANPASVVDPKSARVLLRIDQPQFNHDGGTVNFGPDGKLYISLGDGGAADDEGIGHVEGGNGQDPSNVLGSILRINPLGSNSANGEYGIPIDNPFVGQSGFVDEIYAFGFRNPYRFSFDSQKGHLYVGDVGQNDIEEVDVVVAGGNYGWRLKEGSFLFDPNPGSDKLPCNPNFPTRGCATDEGKDNLIPGLTDPIAEYDVHTDGHAVIGGFVYRGTASRFLFGRYVFGDFTREFDFAEGIFNDGRLFALVKKEVVRGNRIKQSKIVEFNLQDENGDPLPKLGRSLLGFGQDASGELYVLANDTGVPFGAGPQLDQPTGVVLKIVPITQ